MPDSSPGVSVCLPDAKKRRSPRSYILRPAPAVAGLVNCVISSRKFENKDAGKVEKPSRSSKLDFLAFIYDQAPVVGFRVMKNDVLTVRAARYPEDLAGRLEGSVRGKIERLSFASRRRLALVAGNSPIVFRSFVTVSYPSVFPADGKLVKKHLKNLLDALRRRCGKLEYLWFLEFQRRGAPHVHIFLDHDLPQPLAEMKRLCGRIRKSCRVNWESQDWLSETWYRIVGSGDEKHLRAGAAWEVVEKPDGAARYVAKESYKTFQKEVPKDFQNVGRFWGCSKGVSPDEGKMVFANQEQVAAIFPASVDPEGNPFPVMFSAAGEYRKILGTVKDPAKFREWKRGPSLKNLIDPSSIDGSAIGPKMRRIVSDSQHGSTYVGSKMPRESPVRGV